MSWLRRIVLGLFCLWMWGGVAQAQLPLPPSLPDARLTTLSPAGGQRGTTFDLKVIGDDLDDATQLIFDDLGITSIVKLAQPGLGQTGPQPVPGVFTVTIKPDAQPGYHEARIVGRYGVSNPRTFVVGSQPEVAETEPNNSFQQANVVAVGTTINGTGEGAARDYFRFAAKQGQRLLINCEAFRIDSRFDGTLVLFDGTGKELERSRNTHRRDPFLDFTVPVDGDYVVEVHDHVFGYYTLPAECFYRLSISTAPWLDFIFPPCGLPGTENEYTVYGRNLPGGQPAPGMQVDGKPLEMLKVKIALPADKATDIGKGLLIESSESFMDGITWTIDGPGGRSNPLLLSYAGAPVAVETEPNDSPAQATPLSIPCEYVGQFSPRGDRDWITFEAHQGEALSIEVFSQRLGLTTDPSLVIQHVKRDTEGRETVVDVTSTDDDVGNSTDVHWSFLGGILYSTATHDPHHQFVAPETGTYRVMVRDLARSSRSHPGQLYRLSIRAPQPDYRLVVVPRPPTNTPLEGSQRTIWSPFLRRGGAELLDVYAYRRDGFAGDIEITAEQLPPGVTATPALITGGQNFGTLVLQAAEDAPAAVSAIQVRGTTTIGAQRVTRMARPATMVWADQLTGVTYSRSRLANSLMLAVSPAEMAPFTISVPPSSTLETSRLGTVKLPITVQRRGELKGNLTLVAYGVPPIPGNPMHAQPKFHGVTEIKPDQNSVEMTLTVPNPAPAGLYTIFLSATGTVSYARNPAALKAAQDRKAAIEKVVAADAAAAKAAMETVTGGDKSPAAAKAAMEADAKARASAAFLQSFTQEVTKLETSTKSADIQISSPSSPFTLKIVTAPVAFDMAPAELRLKAGTKLDIPFSIRRLFGSTDAVQVNLLHPTGVAGFNVPAITLPKERHDGQLALEVFPQAKPGTYTFRLFAQLLFNGQYLNVSRDIPVTVEAP